MANEFFTIKLPTNAYLQKFLHSIYGPKIIINTNDSIGMFISAMLDKNVYPDKNRKIIHKAFSKYEHNVDLYVSKHWLKKYYYGTALPNKQAVYVNRFLFHMFERELYMYCETLAAAKITRQQSLEMFCNKHNIVIDEDITMDNIVKIEYRYREKIERKNQPNSITKNGMQVMMM
ncbi:hypothetical protein ACFOW1_01765 [Parasediminibacterium paludis]|uniref:Uncharacterized protein n=1 Tax=Parasediminibacterium paludis TaxID=908966 RepID=A0ABV8PSP0_9BACT